MKMWLLGFVAYDQSKIENEVGKIHGLEIQIVKIKKSLSKVNKNHNFLK